MIDFFDDLTEGARDGRRQRRALEVSTGCCVIYIWMQAMHSGTAATSKQCLCWSFGLPVKAKNLLAMLAQQSIEKGGGVGMAPVHQQHVPL